jgi:hypothetical protein
MSSGRYVFDTNTLLSALMFEHSTPGRALLPGVATRNDSAITGNA